MCLLVAPAVLETIVSGEGQKEEQKAAAGAEVPSDGESVLLGFKQQCASGSISHIFIFPCQKQQL